MVRVENATYVGIYLDTLEEVDEYIMKYINKNNCKLDIDPNLTKLENTLNKIDIFDEEQIKLIRDIYTKKIMENDEYTIFNYDTNLRILYIDYYDNYIDNTYDEGYLVYLKDSQRFPPLTANEVKQMHDLLIKNPDMSLYVVNTNCT